MVQGYRKAGLHRLQACFDYFFRGHPFQGGYTIFAGLEDLVRFVDGFRFSGDDIEYLRSLGAFDQDFLRDLEALRFTGDIHAPPEGTPVFPLEPVIRVQGPLEECQLLESALLNIVNFQSLIATKAARVCQEAGQDNVIEFGLRRAQGIDGALTASRSAYIGGCAATSNLLAGKSFDIPVRGTHAHSFVMAFDSELEAFRHFVAIYPESAVLLVDTYNVLESGLPNAIRVGLEMKQRGQVLSGVRIDSGDLAYLSQAARDLLDRAGLKQTRVICSGDLDEHIIHNLKTQGAKIDAYGVGTHLVSAGGDPALSGVYKLSALREAGSDCWQMRAKLTEEAHKMTLPGVKQVFRLHNRQGEYMADIVEVDQAAPDCTGGIWGYHPLYGYHRRRYDDIARAEPLLEPVVREGRVQQELPSLREIRATLREKLDRLHPTYKRLMNPHVYKVSLAPELHRLTERMRQEMANG